MVAKGQRKRKGSCIAKDGEARPALAALSAQHRKFVLAYLFNFNGTQAALAAGYSKAGAHVRAHELLRLRKIADAVDEAVQEYGLSKPTVLHRFAEVFLGADLADFEPFINGEKTLTQLRAEGVNTRVLKAVRTRVTTRTQTLKDGSTVVTESEWRNTELNDPMRAGSEIARLLGYVIERHAHMADMGWLAAMRDMSDEQLLREAAAVGMADAGDVRALLTAGGKRGRK